METKKGEQKITQRGRKTEKSSCIMYEREASAFAFVVCRVASRRERKPRSMRSPRKLARTEECVEGHILRVEYFERQQVTIFHRVGNWLKIMPKYATQSGSIGHKSMVEREANSWPISIVAVSLSPSEVPQCDAAASSSCVFAFVGDIDNASSAVGVP